MIRRPHYIHVAYNSEDGEEFEEQLEGFAARVFLHEFDHLRGASIMSRQVSGSAYCFDPVDGKDPQVVLIPLSWQ